MLVNTGDTILVSQHNPFVSDVAAALTDSLSRSGSGGMQANLAMGGHKVTGMTPGTDPTDGATVSQLTAGAGVPAGTVVDFAGSAAPSGWLLCAGQSVNRADYPDLFTAIGTAFGSASGSTFNLPDCRGRVTAGVDSDVGGFASRLTVTTMTPNGKTVGGTGGTQTHTLTTAQMPSHTHTGSTASAGDHSHTVPIGGGINTGFGGTDFAAQDGGSTPTSTAGAHTHTMSLDNTGSGDAHPNVQPTILFVKIIKAAN